MPGILFCVCMFIMLLTSEELIKDNMKLIASEFRPSFFFTFIFIVQAKTDIKTNGNGCDNEDKRSTGRGNVCILLAHYFICGIICRPVRLRNVRYYEAVSSK